MTASFLESLSTQQTPALPAPDLSNFNGNTLNDLRRRVNEKDETVTIDEMRQAVYFIYKLRGEIHAKQVTAADNKAKGVTKTKTTTKKAPVNTNALLDDLLGNL